MSQSPRGCSRAEYETRSGNAPCAIRSVLEQGGASGNRGGYGPGAQPNQWPLLANGYKPLSTAIVMKLGQGMNSAGNRCRRHAENIVTADDAAELPNERAAAEAAIAGERES